jgi:hypothetical protein
MSLALSGADAGHLVVMRQRYCHRASPAELAGVRLTGAGRSDLELAEQGRRGGRDGVDRVAERLGVVPGGRAETADLPDVLQRGGTDFLVRHLLRVRRAESLDASAHDPTVLPWGPGVIPPG